jgi:hypothetical protein
MTHNKNDLRAAPVVQLVTGLKRKASHPKPDHNNPVTLEEFERERMGIAAKE